MQAWGGFTLDERFADKVLMPGLVEGHCHLKEGSMWDWTYLRLVRPARPRRQGLERLRSMDAVVARLAEVDAQMTAEGRPATEPLIAWGFDPIYFGGERMTVEHVDRASATRPIVHRPCQRPPDERQQRDAAHGWHHARHRGRGRGQVAR